MITAGLMIILYPTMEHEQTKKKQEEIMSYLNVMQKEQKIEELPDGESNQVTSSSEEVNQEEHNGNIVAKNPLEGIPRDHILGAIEIPSIDLQLPLFKKVTDHYLQIGPCKFEETPTIGTVGNAVIAGHRNYRHGDQFNRLDELDKGHQILLYQEEQIYTYEVTEHFIVEADAIWVMDNIPDSKSLTLITCHPIHTGEQRLIIRAVMQSD